MASNDCPDSQHSGHEEEYCGEEAEDYVGFQLLTNCISRNTAPLPNAPTIQERDELFRQHFVQMMGSRRSKITLAMRPNAVMKRMKSAKSIGK